MDRCKYSGSYGSPRTALSNVHASSIVKVDIDVGR
jgi:hypothetical protein